MNRPAVESIDAARDEPVRRWAAKALVVAALAFLLALLPIAVALRALAPPPDLAAALAATLGAAALFTKVTAVAWGLAARLWSAHRASVAVVSVD